jgi:hypothetical protein
VPPAIERQQAGVPATECDHLAATKARQPVQPDGKHEDEQDANEKRRQRHAEQREQHHRLCRPAPAPQGSEHPQRNSHHQRQHGSDQRQLQCGGQPLQDQRGNFATLAQAQAELALRGLGDEAGELQGKGTVESEVGAELGTLLGCRVLTDHGDNRITHIAEQHEGNQGHAQHHQNALGQSAEKENGHRRSVPARLPNCKQ